MHFPQKILLLLALAITCTFGTGFLSSGESPEDAIKAVITAIENNDVKAFEQRVNITYWKNVVESFDFDEVKNNPEWFLDLIKTKESYFKKIKKIKVKQKEAAKNVLARGITYFVEDSIREGSFANFCRKYSNGLLPFDPNILKKAQYGEEGSREYKDITSVVVTMPDGQESVLGLIKYDKKWRVISHAGNRKAAKDEALATLNEAKKEEKKYVERKKNSAKYREVLTNYFSKLNTQIKNEQEWSTLAQEIAHIVGPDIKHMFRQNRTSDYNSEAFWNQVYNGMMNNLSNKQIFQERIEKVKKNIETSAEYRLLIENYFDYGTIEVLWLDGNVMLTKELILPPPETKDLLMMIHRKWLNDDLQDIRRTYIYSIKYKENGNWSGKINTIVEYNPYETEYSKALYYPFNASSKKISTAAETYMLELAKRFEGMYTKAKIQVANEEKWTKEVQDTFTALNKAITDNKPEVFEKHMDLATFLRDRGDIDYVAKAIAKYEDNNDDIKEFLEQVKTGKWVKYEFIKDIFKNIVGYDVSELKARAYLLGQGNVNIFVERKDVNSPWRVIRDNIGDSFERRPKDWDAQLAAKVKIIKEEKAKEKSRKKKALEDMQQKMQTVSKGIVEAITAKDIAVTKYVDTAVPFLSTNTLSGDELRLMMLSALAPMRPSMRLFEKAIATSNPMPQLEILWNNDAWSKATYAFLDANEKNIITTLPTTTGNLYALFVPYKGSYKLIHPPVKDKGFLEKEGNALAEIWLDIFSNYNLANENKELLQFVDLLLNKKGDELVKQVNIYNLKYWVDLLDGTNGLDDQVFATLFKKDLLREQASILAKNVTDKGLLQYDTLTIDALQLETSILNVLQPNLILLEVRDKNLLFAKDNNLFHLEGISSELSLTQRGLLRTNFAMRQNELKSAMAAMLRAVAAQTASNSALDLLKVTNGSYEVFKTEKGNIQLRVKATVQNTYDKPIKPLKFMMYFIDEQGQGWLPWVTKISSETEIKPNQSQTFEWEFFPNEKESYLLQQVQAKKMYFMAHTAEAEIGKSTYKRFGTMVDPKELANGLWQLDNFAPIRPMPQWKSPSEDAQKSMWTSMAQNQTALSVHSGVIKLDTQSADIKPKDAETTTPAPDTEAKKDSSEAALLADIKKAVEDKTQPQDQKAEKPEEQKASTKDTPSPVSSTSPVGTPTAPAPKRPGKAFIVPITTDTMSLTSFAPDQKPDSSIRVLAYGKSPLIAVRVESMGGGNASWKTKDVKTTAQGVLAVRQSGKLVNAKDAPFSIDVSKPVTLELVMQDNGAISNADMRLRVIFFHKDGSRTYSIIQR